MPIIALNDYNSTFKFDELGMTWQVSFIRMVGGTKEQFSSAEQFYLSLIKVVDMKNDLTYGLSDWQNTVDLKAWCDALIIEEVVDYDFQKQVDEALKEIDQYKEDWTAADTPTFNFENISLPKEITSYWLIEETAHYRLPVGSTHAYLVETIDGYFYMEFHLES